MKSSKVQIVIVTSGQVVLKHTLRMNWPMRMHSSFQFERAQELSAMLLRLARGYATRMEHRDNAYVNCKAQSCPEPRPTPVPHSSPLPEPEPGAG